MYNNLQPLNICMSYQTTLNILDRISEDYDVKVQFLADDQRKYVSMPSEKVCIIMVVIIILGVL